MPLALRETPCHAESMTTTTKSQTVGTIEDFVYDRMFDDTNADPQNIAMQQVTSALIAATETSGPRYRSTLKWCAALWADHPDYRWKHPAIALLAS